MDAADLEDRRVALLEGDRLSPFVVLSRAGAIGHSDWPVKVLAVEACGVRSATLEYQLAAQQAAIAPLV